MSVSGYKAAADSCSQQTHPMGASIGEIGSAEDRMKAYDQITRIATEISDVLAAVNKLNPSAEERRLLRKWTTKIDS